MSKAILELLPYIEQKEYLYHCKITEEHLITGQQQAMMESSSREEMEWIRNPCCGPDDTEPEGWSDLRWYQRGSISFAEKDFDKFIERIKRTILQMTKGNHIFQHENGETYVLYEHPHYWIKDVILTRLNIYIYRHAIIEQKEGFVEAIFQEKESEVEHDAV